MSPYLDWRRSEYLQPELFTPGNLCNPRSPGVAAVPRLAKEISETALRRMLGDKNRVQRTVVSLGNPRGLCVRLNPGKQGSAPCYLTYRLEPNGPVQWLPLGTYPETSLEALRDAATDALKQKREGKDPRFEVSLARKRQTEATKKAKTAPTMKDACALYSSYSSDRTNVKESTQEWADGLINRAILPYWGERLVSEITKKEVSAWHKSPEMVQTPSQADAALRILSKIFNLACEEDWRTDNPASKLPKLVRGSEKVRERILSKVERRALERTLRAMEAENATKAERVQEPTATRGIEPAAAGAIRVMLLSAMRLQECLTLRWDELPSDWECDEPDSTPGWIRKDDHKSVRRSGAKFIAITPQLKAILKAQPRRKGSPWIFPSPITPKPGKELGHFVGLQKVWERVKKRLTEDEKALVLAKKKKAVDVVNIEDVHLHDLRRTALSVTFGNQGQTLEALAKVAGHASISTTEKIYAHIEREKLRIASELIATEIAADMMLEGDLT